MNLSRFRLVSAVVAAALLSTGFARAAEAPGYPFFPFCIDWHDAKKRNFEAG